MPVNEIAIRVVQTGPRIPRADRLKITAGTERCAGVLSFGFAAGLSADLGPGTILLPRHILRGSASLQVAHGWHRRVAEMLSPTVAHCADAVADVASVILQQKDKRRLLEHTGAVAADMESAVLADISAELGLPFLVLRVVIDAADDALPAPADAVLDENGNIRALPALSSFLGHPGLSCRLLSRYRRASRALCRATALAWPALLEPG